MVARSGRRERKRCVVYNQWVVLRTVGAWRSLVAHLVWDQGVGGSNPLAPTNTCSASLPKNFLPLAYLTWYIQPVRKNPKSWDSAAVESEKQGKRVPAIFFRTEAGGEPVRDWLKSLPFSEDRKLIGEDIQTVEFGWPIGMPVCRPLGDGIHEVRTKLSQNRIARVLFYVDIRSRMVLLHGFIKKTRKTPVEDLALARSNKTKHQRGLA